jgi:hypothetical protein
MGFFSFNCKGCGHPLLSEYVTSPVNHWMQKAVAIPKDFDPDTQEVRKGNYDGYGTLEEKVGDNTNTYQLEFDGPCVWHQACWKAAGNPTDYEPSDIDEDQGYFFNHAQDHQMEEPNG